MAAVNAPSGYSLVADIGGTNTRVALAKGQVLQQGSIKRFRNADFPGLETILRTYLEGEGIAACAGACVAAAGPVHDGVATMTNLDWTIDKPMLTRATGAGTAAILNDLQAQGHAIGHLAPDVLRPVIAAHGEANAPGPNAAKLVIGVGTGFNLAAVYDTAQGRLVTPSESGHASLPARTEEDLRLCTYLETIHGFPSVEDAISGRGLERIYDWLGQEAGDPAEKSAADIMAGANEGSDARGVKAVATFTRLLGSVAGNMALIHLPFGGIYLVGGVSRAFAPHFAAHGFTEAFRDKGRFAGFMQNFDVTVIEDDYAALTGCAHHLAALMDGAGAL
ncbi:glucokinase [Pseudoruegeria sp. SHC-113]|uniref:glucokinase n=1 Tax=Pseudoruegeria sp. SHC-113 TaxID=2855439 RepID=UPI0021BB4CB4|nr:glucokinase [Pseudoruegeria sp. SHC-113]MCT8160901.1 glucokinase [Pseudoruegeria sp. SHC-113]